MLPLSQSIASRHGGSQALADFESVQASARQAAAVHVLAWESLQAYIQYVDLAAPAIDLLSESSSIPFIIDGYPLTAQA